MKTAPLTTVEHAQFLHCLVNALVEEKDIKTPDIVNMMNFVSKNSKNNVSVAAEVVAHVARDNSEQEIDLGKAMESSGLFEPSACDAVSFAMRTNEKVTGLAVARDAYLHAFDVEQGVHRQVVKRLGALIAVFILGTFLGYALSFYLPHAR